jgi:Tol biopolymer transport system component
MDGRSPHRASPTRAPRDRLDSWKAIAAYLKRDVTTVQRWERREGMPVHRHLHDKQGSVYAFCSELDTWSVGRRRGGAQNGDAAGEQAAQTVATPLPASHEDLPTRPRRWLLAGFCVTLAVAATAYWLAAQRDTFWRNPLADATVTRLTGVSGTEQAASISRDGRLVAFLAERDGQPDAWITEIGSNRYRNLTQGTVPELINPSIRPLSFSPDGNRVTIWTRKGDGSRPDQINLQTFAAKDGTVQGYLPGAAEVAWSSDGRRLVYHTTAPGDPLWVRDSRESSAHQIYVAPAGVHCHFPVWSPDDAFIYFARGVPPDHWDIWRIRPSGAGLERITSHDSLVSHPVMLDRRTLVYLASNAQSAGPSLFAIDVEHRIPHRLNFGLEHYTSLGASADGTRLVVTATNVRSSLSRLSVTPTAARVVPLSLSGLSPRLGPDYLLYIASPAGRQGIWKLANGTSSELWSSPHATIVGGPSIAPDGRRIAFAAGDGARASLYVMDSNGAHVKAVTDTLALRGNPAWAPDGQSIVSAVFRDGEPRLTRIPLDGGTPLTLVSEYSLDPIWSPDGQFLLYSGPDVGGTFALRAAAADGRPYPLPPLILSRGARRVVFWRDGHSVIVLRGDLGHRNFWLVDLHTGTERQLGELAPEPVIGDFDVSRSGDEVVFDRTQEISEIALIERAH